MRRHLLLPAFLAGLAFSPAPVCAAELYMNRIAPYRDPGSISEKVRNECRMDEKLPAILKAEMDSLFSRIHLVDEPLPRDSGTSLQVILDDLQAPGGAGYGPAKSIRIRAVLYEGRSEIARYQRTETSRGGALKYFRSGCGILERIAGEHGEELGDWIDRKLKLRAGK